MKISFNKPPAQYTEVRNISSGAAANLTYKGDFKNRSKYPTPVGWKHPLSFRRDPHKIKYPRAEIFDVEKVKVFFLPDTELPLIDLTILLKAGSVDLSTSKTGLADVFNNVIVRGGTQDLSPGELALVLDENAIQLVGYIGCKGDQTPAAIAETLKLMDALRDRIPEKELELKRLDALNSFVFNVDTKTELVDVYGRYHLRQEPLDTLERIQDAYISATTEDLHRLARQLLDPQKIQIVVVADKNISVPSPDGRQSTLEEELKRLARDRDLPFQEIQLR